MMRKWNNEIEKINDNKVIRRNEMCFVRKAHLCGKIFEGSKSCFIACPSDQSIKILTDLLGEKLTKYGIEPIVAIEERAYGQDIFCTKICGKIIESKFCIVILDDIEKPISQKKNELFPNPNVYYEYGLMTALGKHIIPLQKKDLKLAFNIQSYDTIKYDETNFSVEAERAIKDAIRRVDEKDKDKNKSVSYRTIERKLEFHGIKKINYDDEFIDNIEDTEFNGYYYAQEGCTLLLTIIENKDSIRNIIDDFGVIMLRVKDFIEDTKRDLERRREELPYENMGTKLFILPDHYEEDHDEKCINLKKQLSFCNSIIFGFLINNKIDISSLTEHLKKKVAGNPLFSYSIQEGSILKIKGISIDFEEIKNINYG